MIAVAAILAFIGCLIFIVVAFSYQSLLEQHESGFLHLLLAFMFLCWLPMPIVCFNLLHNHSYLLIGTIFGTLALLMFVVTMTMQAGHLSYSAKKMESAPERWEERDNWMLFGLLSGTFELFAGFLVGLWSIFLMVAFWDGGFVWMGIVGLIFSVPSLFYLFMLLDSSFVKETRLFQKLKINQMLMNLETVVWFGILAGWLLTRV